MISTVKEKINWLASKEGSVAIAGISMIPQQVSWGHDIANLRSWKNDFDEGYVSLRRDIEERVSSFDTSYSVLIENYGDNPILQDEIESIIDRGRNFSVESRWEFESFFAQEGSRGAHRILGYIDDSGKYAPYDDEQFQSLLDGNRVQVNDQTLHGHHIRDVSTVLDDDPLNFRAVLEAEGIRIMTPYAHQNDPIYGHGGSYHNPTYGDTTEITDRYEGSRVENRDIVFEDAQGLDAYLLGISALAGASISGIIQMRRAKDDPRPWIKKLYSVSHIMAFQALQFGSISFIALNTRSEITNYLTEVDQSDIGLFGVDINSDVFADLVGSAGGITAVIATRAGLVLFRDLRFGSSASSATSTFGSKILIAGMEQSGFILIGVILDAFTPIPDPVIGPIVTGLRISWGGIKIWNNIKIKNACATRRVDTMYEIAAAGLMAK